MTGDNKADISPTPRKPEALGITDLNVSGAGGELTHILSLQRGFNVAL